MVIVKSKKTNKIVECRLEQGDKIDGIVIDKVISQEYKSKDNTNPLSCTVFRGTVLMNNANEIDFDINFNKIKPCRYMIIKSSLV